jgi:hypothetical protein
MAGAAARATAPAARAAESAPSAAPAHAASPRASSSAPPAVRLSGGSGQPLPSPVRGDVERSLGINAEPVRVHTDSHASALTTTLSARAVTFGSHIFLGRGERVGDRALIGHEVAHVVQQQGAPRLQGWSEGSSDPYEREAEHAGAAVAHGGSFTVRERTSHQKVQRLGLSDALDYFADKANMIPGFRLLTIIIGINPINRSRVERSAANILRALIEFLPGGGLISQALNNYGIFDKVGAWVETQIRTVGVTGGALLDALGQFLDSLSWSDIFDLGGVWERAKRIFTEPIRRIIDFAAGVVVGILRFIRDAILIPLARLAEGTRGYDLLRAVLGRDPITGEPVPRTPAVLIGGFMKLIGQEEIWNNLQRANAVPRAWAWFQGTLTGILALVRSIPSRFIAALQSLELADIILVPRAWLRIAGVFANFIIDYYTFAGQQVLGLLQIIFEVVAPNVIPYIRKAAGAFKKIVSDPVAFIRNLVRAGIQGFKQFATNFLTHLKASLIGWLTGTLAGANIYIPQAFTLQEIVKFILSVLGLTWQNIRTKLVKAIGEPAVKALETGFDLVVTLVTQGPAAAWEKIVEGITNLRDIVIEQVMQFVAKKIVQVAITHLLGSLNPAGAFIQAILAIYNTIMFFVERLRQIAQVVAGYIDALSAIAEGVIGAAANKVEKTMGGYLTLVISFLARLIGLGNVSSVVVNILNKVRAPIDKALDRVVTWIVEQAKRLGRFIAQAGVPQDPKERLRLGLGAAVKAVNRFAGKRVGQAVLTPLLGAIKIRYGFTSLEMVARGNRWAVRGVVNPPGEEVTEAQTGDDAPPVNLGSFPYKVKDVSRIPDTPHAVNNGGEFAPAPPQPLPNAYIGSTPVKFLGEAQAIADKYTAAFPSEEDAQQRFALVVGWNAIDDLAEKNPTQLTKKVDKGIAVPYPWGILGILIQPNWVENGARANVKDVRDAYKKLGAGEREAVDTHEKTAAVRPQLPLGEIRTQVYNAPFTTDFHAVLSKRATRVFVHVSDGDTVTFNPAGTAPGEALFARYDAMLEKAVNDVKERQAAAKDRRPIVATGGYQIDMKVPEGEVLPGQTDDIRVKAAARLDMAVREAMARIDGRSVYFPEPNLLIELTPQTMHVSFGSGQMQWRNLVTHFRDANVQPDLLFDRRASMATATPDRFAFGDDKIITTWAELIKIEEPEMRAIVGTSQSHILQQKWIRRMQSSYSLPGSSLKWVSAIWAVYFPVSKNLCGYDPKVLFGEDGVLGDKYKKSPYGEDKEIRAELTTTLTSGKRSEEDARKLADLIADLARAGGDALAAELVKIYREASGG